jgi:hypothetical protein
LPTASELAAAAAARDRLLHGVRERAVVDKV